ncbi:zinc finger protein 841 [Biomphalaria pfeifferi]|uniref:Zinc finger protein 841 n=1 Tax=Biomphalaria pfeifferi TaxID=112525 RepID=A0AAD8B6D1_BIOPF|nr:zinc finger protein 841 [Biomphalaria pfeifferi]
MSFEKHKCKLKSLVGDSSVDLIKPEENGADLDQVLTDRNIVNYKSEDKNIFSGINMKSSFEETSTKLGKSLLTTKTADVSTSGLVEKKGDCKESKLSCSNCNFTGKLHSDLQRHMLEHKKNEIACEHCGLKCASEDTLIAHMSLHSDNKPFECLVCGSTFQRVSSLRQHMLLHTNYRDRSCHVCEIICETQEQLQLHMKTHENKDFLTCVICGLKCVSEAQLLKHSRDHEEDGKSLHCPSCSKLCHSLSEFRQHIPVHNGLKSFTCKHCALTCSTKTELNNHLLTHTELNPFTCSLCDFACRSKVLLINHTISHMNDEDYTSERFSFGNYSKDFKAENSTMNNFLHGLENEINSQFKQDSAPGGNNIKNIYTSLMSLSSSSKKSNVVLDETLDVINGHSEASELNNCAKSSTSYKKSKNTMTSGTADNVQENNVKKNAIKIVRDTNQSNGSATLSRNQYSPSISKCKDSVNQNKILDVDIKEEPSSDNECDFLSSETSESQSFLCKLCKFVSQSSRLLDEHLKTHVEAYDCDSISPSKVKPNEHSRKLSMDVTSIHNFRCEFCNYNSKTEGDLKQHLLVHLNSQQFSCPQCSYICTKQSELDEHKLTHINGKPFSCVYCKYMCGSQKLLDNHMKEHLNEKVHLCPHCDYQFPNRTLLKKHLQQNHVNKRPYACDLCPFTCWLNSDLKKHQWIHNGIKPYHCDQCDYRCRRGNRLREHMMIHKNAKPFICSICSHPCRTSHHLKKHMQLHNDPSPGHQNIQATSNEQTSNEVDEISDNLPVFFEESESSTEPAPISKTMDVLKKNGFPVEQYQRKRYLRGPKQFTCTVCPYVSKKLSHLKRHMYCHTTERPFKCGHCEYTSKTEENLRRHMKRHSGTKPLICKLCSYSCFELGDMNQHLLIHTDFKAFKCPLCDYSARKKYHLNEHILSHSNTKSFLCSECGDSFRSNSKLREHMFYHTAEKNIACPHCSFECRRQSELTKHLRKHVNNQGVAFCDSQEQRPYICSVCGFSCKFYSALKHHMVVHSDEKPYSCPHCPFQSRTNSQLKIHVKRHVEGKPFSCQYCPFTCKHESSLRRHRLQHICLKPIQCELCDYTCVRNYDLKRHLQNKHKLSNIQEKEESQPRKQREASGSPTWKSSAEYMDRSPTMLSTSNNLSIDILGTSITIDSGLLKSFSTEDV